jgi:hypothetical protein
MSLDTLSQQVLDSLKNKGLPEVVGELQRLESEANEPWKQALVKFALDTVSTQGPSGLDLLKSYLSTLAKGETPDFSTLSMRDASEVLAVLQRQEANARGEVERFLNSVLGSLLKITTILVTTLFKEI